MTHNKFIKLATAAVLLLGVAVAGCKQIKPEDRIQEVTTTSSDYKRAVLIEDFTGLTCVNCPEAAKVVDQIHETLGVKCVAVSIHGHEGFTPKEHDFFSEDGAQYLKHEEVGDALPAAAFSRTVLEGGDSKYISRNYSGWPQIAEKIAKTPQLYQIDLATRPGPTARTVDVSFTVRATENQKESPRLKVQLWLLESGMVAKQATKSGYDSNYVHKHVLRQALNGTWGRDYNTLGENVKETFQVTKETVKIENTSVVAFVFDGDTNEIYEAAVVDMQS